MKSLQNLIGSNRTFETCNQTDKHNLRLSYRADIDGLRSVAIISVVLYHVFPQQIPGGFLGVDVFFVISGYLISSIIFRSLHKGSFSFTEFYARRIRRIFPALTIVLIVSLFIGRNVMLPNEFLLLARHVTAGEAFVENFMLWSESSYFDISTTLKPLMHLWSLAIEEQFYLFFPIIVWISWRLRFNLLLVVFLIGAASLTLFIMSDPVAAFFRRSRALGN